ncbi:uncharacterized protein LACBIDRAFT_305301 [Laccaria bicolor S238N-H82]|uniref:Predicted protein n=1 Tax=Laccaria bicolor (strain S238N-H82 / ATCC MYA-4686) TaxID=486041 RepID=B0CTW7_LACBS|nr:uncharacterized protein LACBIDRAFT_305301 [Laccaria bicolor S238N-H82]EDR13986.1 predicted protein [Laccaria bicolor S238N-H82]|eukprot:XP_001874545.1 predicted protein [Laccaria bicolor S238N-H82]
MHSGKVKTQQPCRYLGIRRVCSYKRGAMLRTLAPSNWLAEPVSKQYRTVMLIHSQ